MHTDKHGFYIYVHQVKKWIQSPDFVISSAVQRSRETEGSAKQNLPS